MSDSRYVLDLSRNNARPNFVQLAGAKDTIHGAVVEGVILKATEGAKYNPDWDAYSPWARYARSAGLRVGLYHFARPDGGDALAEAKNVVAVLDRTGGLKPKDFRIALDMEATKIDHERLYNWSRTFNEAIRDPIAC